METKDRDSILRICFTTLTQKGVSHAWCWGFHYKIYGFMTLERVFNINGKLVFMYRLSGCRFAVISLNVLVTNKHMIPLKFFRHPLCYFINLLWLSVPIPNWSFSNFLFIFPSPFKSLVTWYFFYILFPWSPFTFLVSTVTPGYTLKAEELELETLHKREC